MRSTTANILDPTGRSNNSRERECQLLLGHTPAIWITFYCLQTLTCDQCHHDGLQLSSAKKFLIWHTLLRSSRATSSKDLETRSKDLSKWKTWLLSKEKPRMQRKTLDRFVSSQRRLAAMDSTWVSLGREHSMESWLYSLGPLNMSGLLSSIVMTLCSIDTKCSWKCVFSSSIRLRLPSTQSSSQMNISSPSIESRSQVETSWRDGKCMLMLWEISYRRQQAMDSMTNLWETESGTRVTCSERRTQSHWQSSLTKHSTIHMIQRRQVTSQTFLPNT